MSVFVCFFAFFGAKIRPAAAGTGELGWDLRDQTPEDPSVPAESIINFVVEPLHFPGASPVEMKFEKRMKMHDVVVKFAGILNHPAHLLTLVGPSGGYLYPYQTVEQCVQPGDRLIIQEISGVWRQQGTMIVRPEHASAAQDAIPGHEELRRSSGEPRMPF